MVGNDIWLHTAANHAHVHRGLAEEMVASLSQMSGIIRLKQVNDERHFVDGIFAEVRRGAVRGDPARFNFEPETALVCRDDLQPGGFADNGQTGLERGTFFDQGAGAGLRLFLIN